jgi:hypothetical protein
MRRPNKLSFNTILAVISVLALIWVIFFGKLLEGPPTGITTFVLGVGWFSFSILFIQMGFWIFSKIFSLIGFRVTTLTRILFANLRKK